MFCVGSVGTSVCSFGGSSSIFPSSIIAMLCSLVLSLSDSWAPSSRFLLHYFWRFAFPFPADRPTQNQETHSTVIRVACVAGGSWRYGVREIKFWRRSGQAARNTQSPSSHSLAASPVASRLRRQDFISRVLTIPLATQAMKSDGLKGP